MAEVEEKKDADKPSVSTKARTKKGGQWKRKYIVLEPDISGPPANSKTKPKKAYKKTIDMDNIQAKPDCGDEKIDLHGFRGTSAKTAQKKRRKRGKRGNRARKPPIPCRSDSPVNPAPLRDESLESEVHAKSHFESIADRRKDSKSFWCGTCDEYMPWREKRDHFKSESHLSMRDIWYYCPSCDERMYAHCREQHIHTQKHFDLLPMKIKQRIVNRRCWKCRSARDQVFKTQGDWLLHCLSEEHQLFLRKKPTPSVLLHSCDICPGNPIFDSIESWNKHCEMKEHIQLKTKMEEQVYRNKVVNRQCQLCKSFHKTQGEWDDHIKSQKHQSKVKAEKAKRQAEKKESELHRKLAQFCDFPVDTQNSLILAKLLPMMQSTDISSDQILEFIHRNWTLRQRFDFVNEQSYLKGTQTASQIEQVLMGLRFTEQWQFLENNGIFINVGSVCNTKLSSLKVGETAVYSAGGQKYRVMRKSEDAAIQQNEQYKTMRHLRLILLDYSDSSKRIVWKRSTGMMYQLSLLRQLQSLMVGCQSTLQNWTLLKTDNSSIKAKRMTQTEIFTRKLIDPSLNQEKLKNGTILSSDMTSDVSKTKKTIKSKKKIEDIVSSSQVRQDFIFGMPGANIKSLTKMNSAENQARLSMFLAKSHLHQEKVVFHGTDPATVPKISKNGFNRDFNTTAMWGRGTYFGSNSTISHSYTRPDRSGSRYMFVCVMGITHMKVGNQSIIKPPILSDGVTQVDTLVNDLANPTILVAMKDSNAVPLWLIEYNVSSDGSYAYNHYHTPMVSSYSHTSAMRPLSSSSLSTATQSTSSISTHTSNNTHSRSTSATRSAAKPATKQSSGCLIQ